MRALVVDRSLEAIAGPPASVIKSDSGPLTREITRGPLDDITLFGVHPSISLAWTEGWGSFGTTAGTNGSFKFQSGSRAGIEGQYIRLDTVNGVSNFSVSNPSDWSPSVVAARLSGQMTNLSFFTPTNKKSVILNPVGGIVNNRHSCKSGLFISSVLYTRALTDDEIIRVMHWLTARYLT